jgi:hypothetical protein
MPISTNAPFNEFGQSQILRDIEQLYLALNGAGSGGPGDGQTQDQTAVTSQDSGGLPDLSGLATIPYVDAAIAGVGTPRALYVHGSGTPTPVSVTDFDGTYSSQSGNMTISGSSVTVPANGVYTVVSRYSATLTGITTGVGFSVTTKITAPYGTTNGSESIETIAFTVGGVAPVFSNRAVNLTPIAVWTGYLSAGETVSITHTVNDSTKVLSNFNQWHMSGITCNP